MVYFNQQHGGPQIDQTKKSELPFGTKVAEIPNIIALQWSEKAEFDPPMQTIGYGAYSQAFSDRGLKIRFVAEYGHHITPGRGPQNGQIYKIICVFAKPLGWISEGFFVKDKFIIVAQKSQRDQHEKKHAYNLNITIAFMPFQSLPLISDTGSPSPDCLKTQGISFNTFSRNFNPN